MTRQFLILILILAIPNLFLPAVLGEDTPAPYMVTMGDSITAGLFANYSIDNPPDPETLTYLAYLAAVGPPKESTNRVHKAFKRYDLSWASGDNPNDFVVSHYERLREYIPDLAKLDLAHSGDTTLNLKKQVESLFGEIKERGAEPVYIVYLIGANDLCASDTKEVTTKKDFRKNVEESLYGILSHTENTKIFVSSIPNIFSLQMHEGEEVFGNVVNPYAGVTCRKIWKNLIPVCKTATDNGNKKRFDLMKMQLERYNEILEETVINLDKEYRDRILFSHAAYNTEILRNDLSFDCFHPSESGQAHFANETWRDGFWPFGF
ncbi:MAG: hypothetical protein A3F16_01780 [Deltaproteobacteria bacterium RIFCSPHIGHO2_12_FULL_43_9]|nr:MAG: hypothetical protein A3F16_01780 [Deltaproteobacteria bacterium RIFCSPHIGHO2_12_FULL_43_9]